MKYVADVLTGLRFVMAVIVLIAGLFGLWTIALMAFAFGVLSDALDGPAARRWPYTPKEEQAKWWRKDPHGLWDNAADFSLSAGGLIGLSVGYFGFGWSAIVVCGIVAIISGCFVTALEVAARAGKPRVAEAIDVVHGWVFGAELLAMTVLLIVLAVTNEDLELILFVVTAAIAIAVVVCKWDRVTSRPEVDYSR